MDGRGHSQQSADGVRVEERSLRILLRWDPELLEYVPGEEGVTSIIFLAGPIQRRFEHPQVTPDRIGAHETARCPAVAAPHDVLVNAIRREIANRLIKPEELG